ncbi:MAG: hypothetical protein RLZZ296_781 [Pseudomonadota bacterium]
MKTNQQKGLCSLRLAWLSCASTVLAVSTPVHAQSEAADVDAVSVRIEKLQQQLSDQAQQIKILQEGQVQKNQAVADDVARPVRVGVAPEPVAPPVVAVASDQPGILTGRGKLVLEPSVQYSYSSSNRVALVGYTVIPSLLIGLVDVRELKRNSLTGALALRYGLTNRLEVEAKVPYVYRYDSTISREVSSGTANDSVFNTSGKSLGDVEVAARYQLNQGGGSWPYLIGSLRFKSRTGKDPFEVVTDCVTRCEGTTNGTGLPLELPTGSGFYSVQPGLTWLFPTDPAVFFGGISYTHSFKRTNLNRQVLNGEFQSIGTVAPGDVLGLNFGMGLALNEKASLSLGIELNSVDRTRQNGVPVLGSVRTQLASLLMGYSYRQSKNTTFNLSVSAGLTQDTPDLSVSIRIPFSL